MTWSKQAGEWLYYFGFLPLIAPLPRGLRQSLGRRQALRSLRRQDDSRFHTIANLCRFLGLTEDQARQVAEESYVMKLADELDAYGYPRLSPKLVASRFQIEGREHLDTLQRQGRGAVLATVHLGSICMAVMAMGQLGWSVYPFTHDSRSDASMGRALNGYSRWRLFWIERRCGGRAIYVDLKASSASKGLGSLEALQVLRQGGFVSMPLDIPPQLVDTPLEADFLGRRCRFPSGPARLAALAKVPIVPYFILRDESDWSRFKLILRPPCEPSGDPAQDLQHCLDPAASLIQHHPQQWTAWDSASQFLADTSAG